jgi:hypothetical protein
LFIVTTVVAVLSAIRHWRIEFALLTIFVAVAVEIVFAVETLAGPRFHR